MFGLYTLFNIPILYCTGANILHDTRYIPQASHGSQLLTLIGVLSMLLLHITLLHIVTYFLGHSRLLYILLWMPIFRSSKFVTWIIFCVIQSFSMSVTSLSYMPIFEHIFPRFPHPLPKTIAVLSTTRRGLSMMMMMMMMISQLYHRYHSLTAHQHQKGHTVPKEVIMIAKSIQTLQSKNCTVREHSRSGQVWTKCPTRPDTQGAPRGGCSHAPRGGSRNTVV